MTRYLLITSSRGFRAIVLGLLIASTSLAGDSGKGSPPDSKASPTTSPSEPKWTDNSREAIAESRKSKKIIMMYFTGSDWCSSCTMLDQWVFKKDAFKQFANDYLVLWELDFPHEKKINANIAKQNNEQKAKYKVDGMPTLVFVDPAKGKELGRITGFHPVDKFISQVTEFLPKDLVDRVQKSKEKSNEKPDEKSK